MDTEIAKLMLENLFDRIELNPQTGKRFLQGAISEREFEAIGFALSMVGGDPSPITPAGAVPVIESLKPRVEPQKENARAITLNLKSLDRKEPEDSHITLCLDFGTAMSRASATNVDHDQLITLPLGRIAGEPNTVFPVSSTLFITRNGRVYFGYDAIKESLNEVDSGRLRFDSPKQHMSRGDFDRIFNQIADVAINPTNFEFTTGDLITLYLSYLTDLACSALALQGFSRYVLRRFAMPCWQTERAEWADKQMKEMLAKAQILADTFSGRWSGGIEAGDLRGALDALKSIAEFPSYLIDQGVLEAIAAASGSLVRGTGQRQLYIVVDVGAGTTDYGLFAVVSPRLEDDRPRVFEVPGTAVVLRQAGDTIDKILLRRILEQEGIESGDPEYDHVNSDLLLRIRSLKENMFRDGTATYNLPTDAVGSVDKAAFLNDERVKKFESAIEEYFQKSLESAHPSWIEGLARNGLNVVVTGGGAGLPMVHALEQKMIKVNGRSLACTLVPHPPDELIDRYPDLESEYAQLAVSIGGTAEELPIRGETYKEIGISTTKILGIEPHYKGS